VGSRPRSRERGWAHTGAEIDHSFALGGSNQRHHGLAHRRPPHGRQHAQIGNLFINDNPIGSIGWFGIYARPTTASPTVFIAGELGTILQRR
jgi:hypothetical protein